MNNKCKTLSSVLIFYLQDLFMSKMWIPPWSFKWSHSAAYTGLVLKKLNLMNPWIVTTNQYTPNVPNGLHFLALLSVRVEKKNSFHFERAYNKEILSKPSYNPMKTKAKNASPIPSSSMDIKDSIPTVKGIQQSYSNSLEDCSMSKLLVFLCVKSETSYLTTHLFSFNVPVCPLGCCTFWWGIP